MLTDMPAAPLQPPLDLLVVAAHPDDAEIGAGGTILACRRDGMRVGVVDLTDGEPTPRGTVETRARETQAASEVLGLDWRKCLGLPNRSLQPTLEARRMLAGVFRLTRPRIVLAHYREDAHPDHVAACELTEAARFWAKLTRSDLPGEPFYPPRILYFHSIHLRLYLKPAFVVNITDFIEEKIKAIASYASQFPSPPEGVAISPLDDFRDRARYWGWSIGTAYGEPLYAREEIGIDSLAALR